MEITVVLKQEEQLAVQYKDGLKRILDDLGLKASRMYYGLFLNQQGTRINLPEERSIRLWFIKVSWWRSTAIADIIGEPGSHYFHTAKKMIIRVLEREHEETVRVLARRIEELGVKVELVL